MRLHLSFLISIPLIGPASTSPAQPESPNFFAAFGGLPTGDGSNRWDENPVWVLGSTRRVEWHTVLANYSIYLWQQEPQIEAARERTTPIYTKQRGEAEPGGVDWRVTPYDFDLSFSAVFWFSLGADDNITCNSGYVNISAAQTPPPSSTSARQHAIRIGLGVGLGVGAPLLLSAVAALLWLLRRRRRAREAAESTLQRVELDDMPKYELSGDVQKFELPEGEQKHEMPENAIHEAPSTDTGVSTWTPYPSRPRGPFHTLSAVRTTA